MRQTPEAVQQHLAERLCWQAAYREDSRVARRLYHKAVVDGVYQLDEGALLDDVFSFLHEVGVVDLLGQVQGPAVQREMVSIGQDVLLSGLKTRLGIERMPALPAVRFSDEALMRLVGFNAPQVRHGVCQRGAAKRSGPRPTGPIGPDTLADNRVQLNLRAGEAMLNHVIRALAKAGLVAATVTGLVDATDLETTAPSEGGGQVTRKRKRTAKRAQGHELEVTVDGWKWMGLLEVGTTSPWAATVVPIQAHETRSRRALVTPARTTLAGHARRHTVVVARGLLDGVEWWWLQPQGLILVVPATEQRAVTIDAQAQAAAGEEVTVGRRAHTVRHGQGTTAWTARLETEVVGITGLTPDAQDGTAEHGRHHTRRDLQPQPLNAVVVRRGHGRDDGPGGTTVLLTNAAVENPLPPFDADDDRRLIEHGGLKASKPPWRVNHPPQKTARAVRLHVLLTFLRFALATA
jgi:hypothetical protein